jgi:RHS repeat-associated protein
MNKMDKMKRSNRYSTTSGSELVKCIRLLRLYPQHGSASGRYRSLYCTNGQSFLIWLLTALFVIQPAVATLSDVAMARTLPTAETNVAPPPATQSGNSMILFAPKRFDVQPGPARTVYENIPLTNSNTPAIVRVQNGATDGSNRVTGAIIQLDGALISTARTFNTSTASLDVPVTLGTNNNLSVRIVGAPGSYLTVSLLARPFITGLNPARARPGESIAISGDYFDDSGVGQNVVRFQKSGGGTTVATVLSVTRAQLSVVVPSDVANGPVSVQTTAGTATSSVSFELNTDKPTITDFNPKRGQVGATVTLIGSVLKSGMQNPTVTFAGSSGRLMAAVISATETEVKVTVPNAAVTGAIELTNAAGSASTQSFFVETPTDFQITAAPAIASTVQGSLANVVVSLTSNQNNFTQLAALTVQGAPTGATMTFEPEQLTAGAMSTLSLRVPASVSPGNYPITIRATATIDGRTEVRTAPATINVQPAGQTTLSGRVLNEKKEPLSGATASLDGKSATTDAAGRFLLVGVNAGNARPVMVDGRTVSAPNSTYPVIAEPADIVAGESNAVPYDFILPRIDTQNEVTVMPNQDTVVTTPRIDMAKMMIPAGANLRNRDGSPVVRASLTPVEIDRTPAPLPSNVAIPLVFTSQPGGAVSDIEMPVTYPNLAELDPNTRVPLYNFNHDTVQWYIYGYGRVTADGRMIVPETNPNTGRPFGLRDFSWHGPGNGAPQPCAGRDCNKPETEMCPFPNQGLTPVAYATGAKLETSTDIFFSGARGSLELTRVYTSDLARSVTVGRFGRGTKDNYSIQLTGTFSAGGSGRLVRPFDATGRIFSYDRTEGDGSIVSSSTAQIGLLGHYIRTLPIKIFEYRTASGEVYRFTENGRLISMADRNSNTTTLSYTGNNLTRVTDPVGRSLTFTYNSDNFVSRVTDPLGRNWNYEYDTRFRDRLVKVIDPLGNTTEYAYDDNAQLTSVTDKRGIVQKQITYDANGRVTQQQFADGGIERYRYVLSGQIVTSTSITDPLGRTTTKRFSPSGYVIEEIDPLFQVALMERDLDTNLTTKITGPCGCPEQTRQYDLSGNVLTSTDRLGRTITYEYEPVYNNLTKMTDRLGRVTTFGYDGRGNLLSVRNALGQTVTFTYDTFGELTSITDPLNHSTRIEYDAQGNIIAITDALNNRSTFEFDAIGRLTAVNDALNRRGELVYDALDRIVTSKDPSGAITQYRYDPNDNLSSVANALNQTWTNLYDKKNRLISTIDPLNRTTRLQYDVADQLVSVISPTKRKVSYRYDRRKQLSTITDGMGGVIGFGYDNRKNLTTLADQRGNVMTFAYDELYRVVAQTDPLGRKTNFEYDAEGNATAIVDRLGRRTSASYDALNRRERISYVDATVSYSYDPAGRLTNINDTQGGTLSYAFDDANRLLSETTPQGIVRYTYNAASQRATMTAADRPVVNYAYDSAGRLRTITQGSETFTYAYDTLSRMQSLQRPNGVTTSYQYDTVNRLARLTHTSPLNVPVEDLQYNYNADDEIAGITSLAAATQLTTAKTAGTADAANRIAQFNQAAYSFDAEGQTTSKTDGTGTTNYQWDARGRMTSIALPGGSTVNCGYDALGRRQNCRTNGVTTEFLYDGQDVVRDRVTSAPDINYLNGPGIDQKLRQSGANGNAYFLPDHLGSTTALTNATGGVLERAQYEAFGGSNGLAQTRYGFTGREREALSGLMFYRARWMDAGQGRFLSEDPSGFDIGFNLYSYVGENPITRIDPAGKWVVFVVRATRIANAARKAVKKWNEFKEWHYGRNQNSAPLPQSPNVAKNQGWRELSPEESVFHTMGEGNEGNRKFISPDGKSEAVYGKNGCLVTDPLNAGSYNFADPQLAPWKHAFMDVLPYFILGNTPEDQYTSDRFRVLGNVATGKAKSYYNTGIDWLVSQF